MIVPGFHWVNDKNDTQRSKNAKQFMFYELSIHTEGLKLLMELGRSLYRSKKTIFSFFIQTLLKPFFLLSTVGSFSTLGLDPYPESP
jgi:hypothetical protein